MKNLFFTAVIITVVFVSCNQKNEKTETKAKEQTEKKEELYACPMHPEVQGKKGESCSKCGMELTEPVKKK